MPAAGSLAALMKEWPLNSVTLSTATHSKLREVLDGTDTQVATCTSNRWTARMKGTEEYITRKISWRKASQFERHQKALVVYQRRRRRSHPRMRPEDRLSPLLYIVGDPALLLTKSSQRPDSWARFSTKFIVLGLSGLGSLTPTVKDPPNRDPTISKYNVGYVFECVYQLLKLNRPRGICIDNIFIFHWFII